MKSSGETGLLLTALREGMRCESEKLSKDIPTTAAKSNLLARPWPLLTWALIERQATTEHRKDRRRRKKARILDKKEGKRKSGRDSDSRVGVE